MNKTTKMNKEFALLRILRRLPFYVAKGNVLSVVTPLPGFALTRLVGQHATKHGLSVSQLIRETRLACQTGGAGKTQAAPPSVPLPGSRCPTERPRPAVMSYIQPVFTGFVQGYEILPRHESRNISVYGVAPVPKLLVNPFLCLNPELALACAAYRVDRIRHPLISIQRKFCACTYAGRKLGHIPCIPRIYARRLIFAWLRVLRSMVYSSRVRADREYLNRTRDKLKGLLSFRGWDKQGVIDLFTALAKEVSFFKSRH